MAMQVGSNQGVRSDINVTPLIDVVLVLLIIFMVITPMLTKGKPVALARGIDPAKKPDDQNDVILSIMKDQQMYLSVPKEHTDTAPMEKEAIVNKLKELQESGINYPLYIKADKTLEYGKVKEAMLACEAAGFKSVALVAEAPQ